LSARPPYPGTDVAGSLRDFANAKSATMQPMRFADRFFHPSLAEQDSVSLDGAEAHHLIHVLRAAMGTEVILFDGSGAEFLARIERIERSAVHLTIIERREVDRELPCEVSLAVALPKGDRQRWLVEKATELGVTQLVPLITARGVAQPTADALRRLRRTVIEASKQCGRNRLMEIGEPLAWSDFVKGGTDSGQRQKEPAARLFGQPGGIRLAENRPGPVSAASFVLAIGPEGGFTDDESSQALDAGWQAIDLGSRILRVETAAIALVAAVTVALPR
jgi:16S rRNA (uracil1498-N3)-methyltransferase